MFNPVIPFTPRMLPESGPVASQPLDGLREPIDFDSDEPLACPLNRNDGEPCESCQ